MTGVALVMPMAGRGSRFARLGIREPKPLIDLGGHPFFYWAVESIRREVEVEQMVFVVLDEHCRDHAIDARIHAYYPQAVIVSLPDVTAGAAETARAGVDALMVDGPVAINDCDHAFLCPALSSVASLFETEAEMALLCFRSTNPAYSYAIVDPDGRTTGTVEKVVASPYAIAGCYMFQSAALFREAYDLYRRDCPYDELFLSGMFNRGKARIARLEAMRHWSFGTPTELASIDTQQLQDAFNRASA